MFITVKFGDGKSEIFNPNCRNAILLHNIKERCDCDLEDMVDLSDETGNVMNLLTNPADYGKQYLTERTAFILLRVEKDGEGEDERITYHPLLRGMEKDTDFLDRLNPKPVVTTPEVVNLNVKGKENKLKNDDSAESPSLSSKDQRRRGGTSVTPTGGALRGNKQANTLKRGGSRVQLGRR